MRGAATRELDAVLVRLSSIGGLIAHGTARQQKEALGVMFERIEVDHCGEITRLTPRAWANARFDFLPNKSPAEMAGPDETSPIMPPQLVS